MASNRALETLQQMLKDYHSTKGVTDRIVLDKTIKSNCDITARACKRVIDCQEEDSPLYFAAYNTRREAIDLSWKCTWWGHAKDNSILPAYDNFKDSVIHLFETTALADVAGRVPELL
ncbi:MAG TPA: hypothetical protein VGJ30_14595 [Candidatus Angelobacter sp.]